MNYCWHECDDEHFSNRDSPVDVRHRVEYRCVDEGQLYVEMPLNICDIGRAWNLCVFDYGWLNSMIEKKLCHRRCTCEVFRLNWREEKTDRSISPVVSLRIDGWFVLNNEEKTVLIRLIRMRFAHSLSPETTTFRTKRRDELNLSSRNDCESVKEGMPRRHDVSVLIIYNSIFFSAYLTTLCLSSEFLQRDSSSDICLIVSFNWTDRCSSSSSYPYGCTCVSSYQISGENLCHNARTSTDAYPNGLTGGSTRWTSVWNICRRFYIESNVLACEWCDAGPTTTNGRNSSDTNRTNKVSDRRNGFGERELRGREPWRNTCRIRYICKPNRNRRSSRVLLLPRRARHRHRRRLSVSPRHRSSKTKDSKRSEKINSNNIARREDISIVQLKRKVEVRSWRGETPYRWFHCLKIRSCSLCGGEASRR